MKTVFMGGKQAGCIGLLTLCATGNRPEAVVSYGDDLGVLAMTLGIPTWIRISVPQFQEALAEADLLVSVHGREIVSDDLLALPKYGGINVHPCLYRYKGANPVGRLLKDENIRASVGVHRMTAKVDEGEVLVEEFVDVGGKKTVEEVYNALYPYYATALIKALELV